MKKLWYLLLVNLISSTLVYAEVKFNGFASIYAGVTPGSDEMLYGYDDNINFKQESKFGLQARADLTSGLTATAQIMARGEDNFEAEFEWAYFTYAINTQFEVSAGRLRIPFFKYSEYLDVGYTFPWARTPRDVYAIDFNTMEGLRFNYSDSYGNWDTSWQAVYGSVQKDLVIGGVLLPSQLNNLWGVSLDMTYDWFSFRLGYAQADVTLDAGLDPLIELFPEPNDFHDIQAKDDYGYFLSGGIFINYEGWLLNAEMVKYGTEESLNNFTIPYYVMIGRSIGDYTFAYTYSFNEQENEFGAADGAVDIGNLDPACPATTTAEFFRNCVIEPESENETHTFTFRWNFHPVAALKAEYSIEEFSLLNNAPSDLENSLFSVGVDLVF